MKTKKIVVDDAEEAITLMKKCLKGLRKLDEDDHLVASFAKLLDSALWLAASNRKAIRTSEKWMVKLEKPLARRAR
jgi:tRNA (Thr-GGU) A37 N-methylase